jgi:glycine/D-amino acid oxidase-like deaminating enzyme
MMQTDVLIVGQGICGTQLGWSLHNAGLSFMIIDDRRAGSASRTAAGVINPVTGRRMVKTWMIEDLLAFGKKTYEQMGQEFDRQFISQKNIIDFFLTPQMRLAFLKRFEEDPLFLKIPLDERAWETFFQYELGFGEIEPGYLIDLASLLYCFQQRWRDQRRLIDEKFSIKSLKFYDNRVQYQDIHSRWVIFCDGIESFNNPWFRNLPFAPNKGEALIIEAMDLPHSFLFKKGLNLVPWKENKFWVGSSYAWEFKDDLPTEYFRKKTETVLQEWLKGPFKVLDHLVSVRPATLERRPFVGFHPTQKQMGILNGMGTKGCSLAPYFANQMVESMTGGSSILPEASIHRFENILRKSTPPPAMEAE